MMKIATTITATDVRAQITASLGKRVATVDLDLLEESFISRWGRVRIEVIPEDIEAYWSLVSDCTP